MKLLTLVVVSVVGCRSGESGSAVVVTCDQVARHALALMPADLRQVDEEELTGMCERDTTPDQRRCVMAARTFDEFRSCGPGGSEPIAPRTPAPPRPEPSTRAPFEVAVVQQALEALRTAALPCRAEWSRQAGTPPRSILFSYTLVVEQGEARAEEVKLSDPDLPPAARECILRAMTAARWKAAAPDGRAKVNDGFAR